MSLLLPVAVYCHIGSNVAAAIVGEPFDGERQAIDPTEPMFDGSHHQVTHVLASDAARSGEEAHSFTITAVQCEGNPHLITVVTANLEAVGAPTPIAFIHGDATVVPPLGTTGMAIEHETVGLHHSVDSLVVGRLAPGSQRPPLEDGMDPPVAVGRQLGDDRLDFGHELVVRWRWPADPLLRS